MAPKRKQEVGLRLRMKEPLRAKIEREAKRGKISMNAAIIDILERHFAKGDAFGGPEIEQIAKTIAANFKLAGDMASGSPQEPPSVWLRNADCFRAAAEAVAETLKALAPKGRQS
jgi:hypothetical protein